MHPGLLRQQLEILLNKMCVDFNYKYHNSSSSQNCFISVFVNTLMVLIPAFKGCDHTVDQSADVGQCVSALLNCNLKELYCLHRNHFRSKSMHCEGCTLARVDCLLALISPLNQIYKCFEASGFFIFLV